jgi:3',5'-cyclic AMP phosphodiesterase CpdA
MRTIAHISDIHFGTVIPEIADALLKDINELKPSLLVASGDFTQRARRKQFIAAREYMDKFNFPKLYVPGNHDIPLFDVIRRFFFPLTRYRKYITDDLTPVYRDEEMIVYGINTARSFVWKDGRISVEQIAKMKKVLCDVPSSLTKVVVTHHPFIPPPGDPGIKSLGRSNLAMIELDNCGVDLLLAGHLHHGYSGDVKAYYPANKRSLISSQAGTATSKRTRHEPNAFNFITIEKEKITLAIRVYKDGKFSETEKITYIEKDDNWLPVKL